MNPRVEDQSIKSIEPRRITAPPAFSPTKFLSRLRAQKLLLRWLALSDLIAEPEGPTLIFSDTYGCGILFISTAVAPGS